MMVDNLEGWQRESFQRIFQCSVSTKTIKALYTVFANKLFDRALQIIQDEEYLDDVDFDEIKRRKRQSPFTKNQSEDKTISETMEAFNHSYYGISVASLKHP